MGQWKIFGVIFVLAAPLNAHDLISTKLTWTVEISRLMNRHCLNCHGEGASIPLTTYEEARPWAKAIRDQVMRRQMPPWGAVAGFGPRLQANPEMTQSEVETVVRWVEGGAPKGDEIWLPHAALPLEKPSAKLNGPLLQMGCDWTVPFAGELMGLRPDGIGLNNTMQITLTRPDGEIVPVIWIREYPTKGGRDFVFVKPLAFAKGSVLHVEADVESDAALAIRPTDAWLRLPEIAILKQIRNCPAP